MKLETYKGAPVVWAVTYKKQVDVFCQLAKALEHYDSQLSFFKELGYTVRYEIKNDGCAKTASLVSPYGDEISLALERRNIIDWHS